MTITQKAKLFKSHGIRYMTNVQNSEITVEDLWTRRNKDGKVEAGSNLLNATEWSKRQVFDWLGY